MARPTAGAVISGITLDPRDNEPLTNQLFSELREAVITGRLAPGTQLPSTRAMAQDLQVSRTTVLGAFERLKAEGYFVGKAKSGTFTNDVVPDSLAKDRSIAPEISRLLDKDSFECADRIGPENLPEYLDKFSYRPFDPAVPAIDSFPTKQFSMLQRKCTQRISRERLVSTTVQGYAGLREEIVKYVASGRGVQCDPDQVFITSGTRQSFFLPLFALSNPGDSAWVEDPGYPIGPMTYDLMRLKTIAVPVDSEGIIVSAGKEKCSQARFAYVTPARQYPMGHTMSAGRRLELLNWAYENNSWILEDDYDGEYRFDSQPAAALQNLDAGGRVIYIGTFSKTILPTLGVGYVIAPKSLVDLFSKILFVISRPPDLSLQLTVAEFMAIGGFGSHIRRMRTLYKKRQNALAYLIRQILGDLIELDIPNAGLHLIGNLAPGFDELSVSQAAMARNLLPRPMQNYLVESRPRESILLGFAGIPETEMEEAVVKLRAAILESA